MLTLIQGSKTWKGNLATFLQHCAEVRCLNLCFQGLWKETEDVFNEIMNNVRPKHLKNLALENMECTGKHLYRFLK